MELLACVDGILNFVSLHLDSVRQHKSFTMKTGNDVLTDFTGFVSLHCDRAFNSTGLKTYACTDGRSKRLHMFTSASSLK